MRLNYHRYSKPVATSRYGRGLLRVWSPGHAASAYFVQDVVCYIVEVAPVVSVSEYGGHLDGSVAEEHVITIEREEPIADRFLGVPSVLLKQPRTATLIADNEGDLPCRMLLIKRRARRSRCL